MEDMMDIEDLEELKAEIVAINLAVERIRDSGISWDALYMLVQQAAGNVGGKKIPIRMIRAVFFGFEGLKEYVFPDVENG